MKGDGNSIKSSLSAIPSSQNLAWQMAKSEKRIANSDSYRFSMGTYLFGYAGPW